MFADVCVMVLGLYLWLSILVGAVVLCAAVLTWFRAGRGDRS